MEKSNIKILLNGKVLQEAEATEIATNRLQEVQVRITLPDGNFSFGEALVPEAIIDQGPEVVWKHLFPHGRR